MATRRAWVLNLDADLELAGGAGYTPSARVKEAMQPHVATLAQALLGEEDLLVDETTSAHAASGLAGVAFCPTPRAIALLHRAGASPEPCPPVAVLAGVNSRAFAASLGGSLPGSVFAIDLSSALVRLQDAPQVGTGWRVKLAFGMTGRNQRVVAPGHVTPEDEAFVSRGLAMGGVQIEPDVLLVDELSLHGMLGQDGCLRRGALTRQRCTPRGAWMATERLPGGDPLASRWGSTLRAELDRVAEALVAAGYFGPFGIDAFTYRGADHEVALQPLSEINARYSMGFAVGMRG